MNKLNATQQVKRSAHISDAKSRLLQALNDLERDGLRSEAHKLGRIIARLEAWQNS